MYSKAYLILPVFIHLVSFSDSIPQKVSFDARNDWQPIQISKYSTYGKPSFHHIKSSLNLLQKSEFKKKQNYIKQHQGNDDGFYKRFFYNRTKLRKQDTSLKEFKHEEKCNGVDNFLSDIGVMSYMFGIMGTMIGFFTMLVSFVTQIQTVLSAYIVGIPSSLVALNSFFGDPSSVSKLKQDIVNFMSIVDAFVNLTFASPVNGLVNIIDIFGAIFSFLSLYIGAISTFPDTVKYVLKNIFGTTLETYVGTYGCPDN